MKGEVLSYDAHSGGVISAEDGQRYEFRAHEVMERAERLRVGHRVDFVVEDGSAVQVYPMAPPAAASGEKSRIAAALLALFIGGLGIDKFYLGKNTAGVVMLVGTLAGILLLFIPTLVVGLIAFIEAIIYLVKSEEQFQSEYVYGDKAWF